MTKLFVIAFTIFSFVGSFSLPAFSQIKAAPKKNVRAVGAKKTTRAATSSSTSSRARAVGTNRRRVGSAGSVSTGSSKGATSADGVTSCQVAFTECMDMQIADVIARYPYINNDPAVQAIQDTGDELRCIYYSLGNVEKLFAGGLTDKYCTSEDLAARTNIKLETETENEKNKNKNKAKVDPNFNNLNVCSNQKDFNDLYFSYNYYCDLNTSDVGTRGIPINKCNLKQSSAGIGVSKSEKKDDKGNITTTITLAPGSKTASASKNDIFATKDSYAYYAEALNRVENDELKIINFEESNLFKNKIKGMNLENWDMMSLRTKYGADGKVATDGTDSVNDLISDLGLTNTGGLFSINVAPPVGAGSLDPAAIFRKASDICFSGVAQRPKGKTLTDRESKLNTAITKLNSCKTGSIVRDDAERYYLAGTVVKPCKNEYYFNSVTNKCVDNTETKDIVDPFKVEDFASGDNPDVELVETDFLSAKKSCDLYENTLISTRNDVYGKFDTAIVGFIEDQVAKLIKKKSKDLNTIASAFQSLEQTDADISISSTQAKLEVFKTKSDAQIQRVNTEANLTLAQKDAYTTQINANQELAKLFLSTYEKKLGDKCYDMGKTAIKAKAYDALFGLKVKVDEKGDVQGSYPADTYAALDKKYHEFDCTDIKGFDISSIIPEDEFGTCTGITLAGSGTLPRGFYKLTLAGAGGGGGSGRYAQGWGGNGGKGGSIDKVFAVSSASDYTLNIGAEGKPGDATVWASNGEDGGDGGATTFNMGSLNLVAGGGGGGKGGKMHRSNGDIGQCAGNCKGSAGGKGGKGYGGNSTLNKNRRAKRAGANDDNENGDGSGNGSFELKCLKGTSP